MVPSFLNFHLTSSGSPSFRIVARLPSPGTWPTMVQLYLGFLLEELLPPPPPPLPPLLPPPPETTTNAVAVSMIGVKVARSEGIVVGVDVAVAAGNCAFTVSAT